MATIFNELNNKFAGVFLFDPVASGPVTVTQDGIILNSLAGSNEEGLGLGGGAYSLTVNGLISTTGTMFDDTAGVFLSSSSGLSKIIVGTTGHIYGTNFAIISNHATNITNAGVIGGGSGIRINGGASDYTITNTGIIERYGSLVENAIKLEGTGKHTVTNKGDIHGTIFATGGTNIITNTGLISGALGDAIALAGGADAVTNKGIIELSILTSNGNDVLNNSGEILGFVRTGKDNDKFTNTGLVTGTIDMGDGDDIFTGGKFVDLVEDDGGADIYKLGDGLDVYNAINFGDSDGLGDKIDGGGNTGANAAVGKFGDTYDASLSIEPMLINLDTKDNVDVQNGGPALFANTAIGDYTGLDYIKNFEAAYGGLTNDVIFGNSLANEIKSNAGDDVLYGGAGRDSIDGGGGTDHIFGDTGRDLLTGGADNDFFHYRSVADSTLALTGRDLILDFELVNDDTISFFHMGLNNGHYVGVNANFDGNPDAVRVLSTAAGWTVQLDVNGDLKADLAIDVLDVSHSIFWSGTDFAF